jgi:hypothetical protein
VKQREEDWVGRDREMEDGEYPKKIYIKRKSDSNKGFIFLL